MIIQSNYDGVFWNIPEVDGNLNCSGSYCTPIAEYSCRSRYTLKDLANGLRVSSLCEIFICENVI